MKKFIGVVLLFSMLNAKAQFTRIAMGQDTGNRLNEQNLRNAPDSKGVLLKRSVLGLYNSPGEYNFTENSIQVNAQSILNYFGYYSKLLDVNNQSLPDDGEMEKYTAILMWFSQGAVRNASAFLIWLEKQQKKGIKIIILGYTGLEQDYETGESLSLGLRLRMLSLVGLSVKNVLDARSLQVETVYKHPEMIDFEYKLNDLAPGEFEWNVPIDEDVTSWLVLKNKARLNSESTIVSTSPKGGYVKQGYTFYDLEGADYYQKRWIINPFLFFGTLFGTRGTPMPDPTTINGKRVFYTHIDGDGAHSKSRIKANKYNSEIIADLISRYPQFIFGVSAVAAEIDPQRLGNKRLVDTMKRIFAMDNVEIASHTYNHPYKWRDPGRNSGYLKTPFNLEEEIIGSINYINTALAPKNKKTKVLYWSGDTTPPEKAFEILEKLGLQSLNGGDGVFDPEYNSYTNISPFVRPMGKYWQIHSSQSNENLYTKLWRKHFSGLSNVIITFKKTEKPYRIGAANLYYHFYSGERQSSLNALKTVYDWVLKQDYTPVSPSEYIGFVEGFLTTQIHKLDLNQYLISGRGTLNSFRLDEGTVSLEKSYGVKKVTRTNSSMYITLDSEIKNPVIYVNP
ncbi:MAG: hypothetical protein GY786_22310 [Proteobacteria bacterium]|nr:hypothetical protein [Pseudomonadota bacterium]